MREKLEVNMNKFAKCKRQFDEEYETVSEFFCFLPVHMNFNKMEYELFDKKGYRNEQYYKWQFLTSFIKSGLCTKDYIGVEINLPKGNKNAAMLKIDAVIFDSKEWIKHYRNLHTRKDESKWDSLNWLRDHILCVIEFKKNSNSDIKGVFNSQLKAYMNESTRDIVFGIIYDEGRLYLFRSQGKKIIRLSDEFNIMKKNTFEATVSIPDPYENLMSFSDMCNYNSQNKNVVDYSNRSITDLDKITKLESKKVNDALYQILYVMDKCGLVNQRGYNILIQLLALKIYDEKNNKFLQYYINPNEQNYENIADIGIQNFLTRISDLKEQAKTIYYKILGEEEFNIHDINHVKFIIEIVKQFQNYNFHDSKESNLYQLVFYQFASHFSKADNAQFITPLQIIEFIVDIINPRKGETIIDPTVGIADFLSISYTSSESDINDKNIYGIDIDKDMVRLATLNMLLSGDGNATIEAVNDGLGSINTKFSEDGKLVKLIPRNSTKDYNYNGDWDNRPDNSVIKKFDIVLTNPPFGDARAWTPSDSDIDIAECYELWNLYKQKKIDLGVIFLENAVRILKENGRMAIVLSNSIASIDAHKIAREWLYNNLRIVAIFDLPSNIFAEAGVSPTIIVGYKASKKDLELLKKSDYQIFSKQIERVDMR